MGQGQGFLSSCNHEETFFKRELYLFKSQGDHFVSSDLYIKEKQYFYVFVDAISVSLPYPHGVTYPGIRHLSMLSSM